MRKRNLIKILRRLYWVAIIRYLPHNLNIIVFLDYDVELEPRSDGQGKAKLWSNIHVELVFIFVWLQSLHSIAIGGIRLVEMGVGERNGGSLGQVRPSLAWSHVEHTRLVAVESLLLHAVTLVAFVLHLGVGIVR